MFHLQHNGLYVVLVVLLAGLTACARQGQTDVSARLLESEARIETALSDLEQPGQIEQALDVYQAVERDLLALDLSPGSPHYRDQQRLLAYSLMRSSNVLRQLDRTAEAMAASERELEHARLSGDDVTLARTLLNFGPTLLIVGDTETGMTYLEEARVLFENGDSYDHVQGLGWYWILQADLGNAGLVDVEPEEVIQFTNTALELLEPIENWPGVARAYAARARAHEALEMPDAAAADRANETKYSSLTGNDRRE